MRGQKFIPLVVVAAGLLAYQNSFKGAFFQDDFGSITENPTIRHLWPIWQCLSPPHRGGLTVEGRPLINLSLAINYALGGTAVWGYHALNLFVHILAGLTLFGIVRRTLLQPRLRDRFGAAANELALATAALWTVHPLQTESVTYIIQRAESIMGLFYLLTLYCFIRGVEAARPRLWYGLCVGACALGMVSKEVMVSAPLIVLLYDRAFVSGSFREAWCRRLTLYLGLAGTWILFGVVLASGQVPATAMTAQRFGSIWWQYLATQPGVILYYLRLSVWPSPLFLGHGWPTARTWMSILPPTVVVVSLLAASAWAWKGNSVWGFVAAWFFLILAPSSSFIPLHDLLYEHRMYLSLAAVVSLVVMGLYSALGRRSLAVFVVVAIGLGFLTWRRNQDYRMNPHYSLGIALSRAGRFQEAIAQYEQALRLNPNMAEVHLSWGLALTALGRFQEAIGQFEQALRINPGYAQAHNDLGGALRELGRMPQAIAHWEQAVRIDPDCAEAHYNLGNALMGLGKLQEAVEHYEQAVRIRSNFAEAHCHLGVALARLARVREAIGQWEETLRINPDDADAHYNLGNALLQTGKLKDAIRHYDEALRIKPDYAEAHNNLGNALFQADNVPEAIRHWEQAVSIKPDYAEAHYNLGIALEQAGRVPEAIGHYEQAVRLKPDYVGAQTKLARQRAVQ